MPHLEWSHLWDLIEKMRKKQIQGLLIGAYFRLRNKNQNNK